MMDENAEREQRKAVTRLTSGEAGAVPVIVTMPDGTEDKMELTVHSLARMIPVIITGDLDRLINDVKKNGVNEPLIMFEGKVLDGRNRIAVASVLGVPVKLTEFNGSYDEAKNMVWSLNAARRHLSTPQIALAAERFGFIKAAKSTAPPRESGQPVSPWAHLAAKRVGNISPRTLERFHEARVTEAPDTVRLIDEGQIRRVDKAINEAVAERSVLTGLPIEKPPPIPRSAFDSLGCARSDVLRAERAVLAGERGAMTATQFAERAREIQAALIRIQSIYKYGTPAAKW